MKQKTVEWLSLSVPLCAIAFIAANTYYNQTPASCHYLEKQTAAVKQDILEGYVIVDGVKVLEQNRTKPYTAGEIKDLDSYESNIDMLKKQKESCK